MLLVNQVENQDVKVKIIDAYRKTEKRDREKILKRKNIIENRKEELEVISREKVIISELVSFMSVYPVDLVWVFQSSKRIAEYSIIIISQRFTWLNYAGCLVGCGRLVRCSHLIDDSIYFYSEGLVAIIIHATIIKGELIVFVCS